MELFGFSFIMREIRKLILQLHVLSLAGELYVVSGEISKCPVLITVNTQRWHPIKIVLFLVINFKIFSSFIQ